MPRLFIGLELPDTVTETLLSLHRTIAGARWQSAEQLHLTLRFIGQVDDAMAQAIHQTLSQVETARFDIELQRIRCQGNLNHPRTLWADAQPTEPLAMLHNEISNQLSTIGLPPENRRYRPHVTLARFRKNAASVASFLAAHSSLDLPAFTVTRFTLFKSTVSQDGSRYDVIARYPLSTSHIIPDQ